MKMGVARWLGLACLLAPRGTRSLQRASHQTRPVIVIVPALGAVPTPESEGELLRKFQTRNVLLEEAVKTLRQRLDSVSSSSVSGSSGDARLRQRADEAQALAAELQAQVESERKRAERIRLGWQSELLRVSERAAQAEEEAESQRQQVEVLSSRLQALESSAFDDARQLDESKGRIRALERDLATARSEMQSMSRSASPSSSSVGLDDVAQASIAADLRAQRVVLERQSRLIEGLVRDLSEARGRQAQALSAGSRSGPPLQWSLPEGDASRVFSVQGSGTTTAARKRPEEPDASPCAEVQTREIIVGGEPYLVDEDNNLYSVGDHAFVRRLSVTVDTSTPPPRPSPPSASPSPSPSAPRPPSKRQRLARLVGRASETARTRMSTVGRTLGGLGRWLVGVVVESGGQEEGDEGDEEAGPVKWKGGAVVDVELEEGGMVLREGWDGYKMRPSFMDAQQQQQQQQGTGERERL